MDGTHVSPPEGASLPPSADVAGVPDGNSGGAVASAAGSAEPRAAASERTPGAMEHAVMDWREIRVAHGRRLGRRPEWDRTEFPRCRMPDCHDQHRHHCRMCGGKYCGLHADQFVPAAELPSIVRGRPLQNIASDAMHSDRIRICRLCAEFRAASVAEGAAVFSPPPEETFASVTAADRSGATREAVEVKPSWICLYDQLSVLSMASDRSPLTALACFNLGRFQSLQLALPDHPYTEWERLVLWYNSAAFRGHSTWTMALVYAIPANGWAVVAVRRVFILLLDALDFGSCESHDAAALHCGTGCTNALQPWDVLQIICHVVHGAGAVDGATNHADSIFKRGVQILGNDNKASTRDLVAPFLRRRMLSDIVGKGATDEQLRRMMRFMAVGNEQTAGDPKIAADLFSSLLTQQADTPALVPVLQQLSYELLWEPHHDPRVDGHRELTMEQLGRLLRLANALAIGPRTTDDPRHSTLEGMAQQAAEDIRARLASSDSPFPLRLPWSPVVTLTELQSRSLRVLYSARCPLLITLSASPPPAVTLLFKTGDDVRRDCIVIAVIRVINLFLMKDLELSENVLRTYSVFPCGVSTGIIQCLEGAQTIATAVHLARSLDAFLRSLAAPGAQRRFVRSSAAWAVVTYVLGITDRHCANIMVGEDGAVAHIDFSFILGEAINVNADLTAVPLDCHTARFVTAAGETETFVAFALQVYRSLRTHAPLLYAMLHDGANQARLGQELRARLHMEQEVDEAVAAFEAALRGSIDFQNLQNLRDEEGPPPPSTFGGVVSAAAGAVAGAASSAASTIVGVVAAGFGYRT
eukprot:c504_g1_i1.p1 GENE.c504_g1_i1~~c504_g1_i1.p1  ORF type:complete len:813 (-),score=141.65 c504_g1_i1:496-2934(-)